MALGDEPELLSAKWQPTGLAPIITASMLFRSQV